MATGGINVKKAELEKGFLANMGTSLCVDAICPHCGEKMVQSLFESLTSPAGCAVLRGEKVSSLPPADRYHCRRCDKVFYPKVTWEPV